MPCFAAASEYVARIRTVASSEGGGVRNSSLKVSEKRLYGPRRRGADSRALVEGIGWGDILGGSSVRG